MGLKMNIISQMKSITNDKHFINKTVSIAVPIALQNLLNTLLNFIDTLMIGRLGENSIAAVGLANKVFFVFSLFIFGIVSGSGVLTAQYWGKREVSNIRKVLGMSLILSLFAALLFTVPSLISPKSVMRIFTTDKDIIKTGAIFLSIIAFSYPFTAITNSYVALLRGVNQVKTPVIITSVAICINIFLNYVLINGYFGFPRMGVAGSATATLIARIIECSTVLIFVYWNKGPAAAKLNELLHIHKSFLKKYIPIVTPVIANECMWGLGVTMYSLVYGRMGSAAMAAITINQTVEQLMTVLFMGISNAAAVILGNEMGAGHLKEADKHAKNLILIQLLLTLFMAGIGFIIRQPIITLFSVSGTVADYFEICFLVFLIYMPFKMFNFINVVGILRSGGDTKACLFLDCSGVWLIGIPMAFIGGLVLHFPIYIVYAMVTIEELYKFTLGFIRYRQKKWLRNIVAADYE
jgi:putative MATE family efflux protein